MRNGIPIIGRRCLIYENKLSNFFEDIEKARHTLDNVREFVRNNPTVYLSTHTPLGYENLENKRIVDLDNPPESILPKDIFIKQATGKDVNKEKINLIKHKNKRRIEYVNI